ncbi:MAG TPA: hypothetical protein VNW97_01525 [Candidatus Saccharimonadales bacterium]|jgi:hypothetical protein|nr:hypothetical protein [Candidatus Saccharimonadales bacterium]
MPTMKKPVVRPNLGSSLRPRAKSRRDHFLVTDFTEEEQKEVLQYCLKKKISVSQFLADLVLQDAASPKPAGKQKVLVRAEFELTVEEREKLELLARLHKKDTIGQLVRELLQPSLDMQRTHAPLETTSLRYYLSKEEHGIATRHMAGKGISARNYAAMLALKAMARERKKQK